MLLPHYCDCSYENILKAIWVSRHWYHGISICIAKIFYLWYPAGNWPCRYDLSQAQGVYIYIWHRCSMEETFFSPWSLAFNEMPVYIFIPYMYLHIIKSYFFFLGALSFSTEDEKRSTQAIQAVNAAWEVLRDPAQRTAYNQKIVAAAFDEEASSRRKATFSELAQRQKAQTSAAAARRKTPVKQAKHAMMLRSAIRKGLRRRRRPARRGSQAQRQRVQPAKSRQKQPALLAKTRQAAGSTAISWSRRWQ